MSPGLKIYVASYLVSLLAAAVLLARCRRELSLFRPEYRRFLFQPWKIATFAIATGGFIIIGPYSGDPTWDGMDALFMSVLTFLTAPWGVAMLYRFKHEPRPGLSVFLAAVLWMFSASWSYDLYIYGRDGHYPPTWAANIVASSLLYFLGGLLWNLHWMENCGVRLAFRELTWPPQSLPVRFRKVAAAAVPLIFLVVTIVGFFFFLSVF